MEIRSFIYVCYPFKNCGIKLDPVKSLPKISSSTISRKNI